MKTIRPPRRHNLGTLVVLVDTDDTRWTTDDLQRQGYGISSLQVSQ